MSNADEIAGVFDVIDAEKNAHAPVDQEVSEPKAEGGQAPDESKPKQKPEETKETETGDAKNEPQPTETKESQESSQEPKTKTETKSETSQEVKTDETSKTETKSAEDFSNWRDTLPPPPQDYDGKKPEFNDDGQITNMDPQEYNDYIAANAALSYKKEAHNHTVEVRAFQVAEEIIPEIKDNPAIRQMVQNARIASHLDGNPIDTVAAALQVRDALGLAPERIQAAKAEGAQNAKASIKVQKNAALETGSTKTPDKEGENIAKLQKRIRGGDDQAFVELLGVWDKKGLL